MIPSAFRGTLVPAYVKSKTQLVAWALEEFQNSDPITNWEFVRELYCHRFGGILFNLRQEGYEITTLKTKTRKEKIKLLVSSDSLIYVLPF